MRIPIQPSNDVSNTSNVLQTMRHLPRPSNAADCWDKLDADQAKLDVAKANRDKKKADMAKRQPSSKESKAYTAAIASKKVWRILN